MADPVNPGAASLHIRALPGAFRAERHRCVLPRGGAPSVALAVNRALCPHLFGTLSSEICLVDTGYGAERAPVCGTRRVDPGWAMLRVMRGPAVSHASAATVGGTMYGVAPAVMPSVVALPEPPGTGAMNVVPSIHAYVPGAAYMVPDDPRSVDPA